MNSATHCSFCHTSFGNTDRVVRSSPVGSSPNSSRSKISIDTFTDAGKGAVIGAAQWALIDLAMPRIVKIASPTLFAEFAAAGIFHDGHIKLPGVLGLVPALAGQSIVFFTPVELFADLVCPASLLGGAVGSMGVYAVYLALAALKK